MMIKKYIKMFSIPSLLMYDTISVFISVYIGLLIHFGGQIPSEYLLQIVSFGTICALFMIIFGIIFGSYYNIGKRAGTIEIVRHTAAIACVYLTFSLTGQIHEIVMPVGVVFLTAFATLFFTLGIRLVNQLLKWIDVNIKWTQNSGKYRVLIIGAGETGISLARNLINKPQNEKIPIGYLDDNRRLWNNWILQLPVFGGCEMLKSIIIRYKINEVVIAIKDIEKSTLRNIFEKCNEAKCKLKRYDLSKPLDDYDVNKVNIKEVSVEELLGRDPIKTDMRGVKNFISDKVVMVTGGVGSIGSEICRQVIALGCSKLIIFDFNENGLFDINTELSKEYDKTKYELVLGSIRDINRLDYVFKKYRPQVVFHAAAHKHVPMMELNPYEAVKNNIIGTINVARKSDEYDTDSFILISSDKAVNPPNIMGATKRIAELAIQIIEIKSKTKFATVRFGNVLGSNGSVVPLFKKQIEYGGPVTVTHPDMERYFMTIPEAVQLVLQASSMSKGGEIFVLDMGKPIKIYDLAVLLIQLSGLEPEKDIKIEFTGLRPGEKLFEEISMSDEEVNITAYEKIFVLKNGKHNYIKLSYLIEKLVNYVDEEQERLAFSTIHDLVPSYVNEDFVKLETKRISTIELDTDKSNKHVLAKSSS
jgi:FlaA1/EpsC-like NDP-sugar epimerase